jgi:tetratricopeptide (TPR) repeat protein
LAADHPKLVWVPDRVRDQAEACTLRGLCRAEAGQQTQAEGDFRQAIALVGQIAPQDHPWVLDGRAFELRAEPHFALGRLLWASGREDEAGREFDRAEQEWRAQPSSVPRDTRLAWLLATCPDAKRRKPAVAVQLAKKATEGPPRVASRSWLALGVAQYRNGNWKESVASLDKSMKLHEGGDGIALFSLAMSQWRLGEKAKAREWHDKAVAWTDKNRPQDEELCRFRAEAAQLLGVSDSPPPNEGGAVPGK